MTGFLVAAALMTIAALAFVLPPMLRRRAPLAEDRALVNAALHREQLAELDRERASGAISEAAWAEAKREVERRLLEDAAAAPPPAPAGAAPRGVTIAVGVLVPVIAIAGYLLVGTPAALDPMARMAPENAHTITPEQVAGMVEKLAARLEKNPEDAEGWTMLARSYSMLGNYDGAVKAYAMLAKLGPPDAKLLADHADALAMARGRKLAGEPFDLVKKALALDARHPKALALAGSAEFEAGNFAGAVTYWERLIDVVGRDTEFARQIAGSVAEARALANPGATPAPAKPAAAPAAGPTITGTVKIAPALAKQFAPGDALFVYARPADGGRMPVAIVRATAAGLPLAFTLDDSSAMTPTAKLSGQKQVIVEARISRSGDAKATKGDLRGVSKPVAPGASGLEILIDTVVE